MDKVSEIFSNIKDRLSNPFLFSFLISWIICNWRIPVALLWFDEKQISANGCSSIFEFIQDDWKNNGYFWWPLFWAFLYTFGFPIFKNIVSAFQTWIVKWGEDWNIKISKNGKIEINKYLKLRQEYFNKIKELEDVIDNEIEVNNKNVELISENLIMKNELKIFKNEKKLLNGQLENINNINIIKGDWKLTVTFASYNEIGERMNINKEIQIYINGNDYYEVVNDVKKKKYKLNNFYFNPVNLNLTFIKKLVPSYNNELEEDEILVCSLRFSNEFKTLMGGDENRNNVEYIRI